jgi:hypothetical protein
VAKDIRTFFRDTTQWSQLMLLAVLVVGLRLQHQGAAAVLAVRKSASC